MADPDPRRIFADRLTLLWVEAGRPTYERLAREAQDRLAAKATGGATRGVTVTKQRISAWRTGRQVPREFLGVSAVIGALVACAKRRRPEPAVEGLYSGPDWHSLWQRAVDATERSRRAALTGAAPAGAESPGAESSADAPEPGDQAACPYRGLAPFGPGDAPYFFGRDRATQRLVERVDALVGTGGLLVLVAPSGAGKSSLLGAGLVLAIRDGRLTHPDSGTWPVVQTTPGPDPLAALGAHLPLPAGLAVAATVGPRLAAELREAAERAGGGGRLVIVVDQFEEVFTLCGERERRLFIDVLDAIATGPDAPALVVLGMRSDFYARCLDHPPLVDALQRRHVVLGPMSVKELTEAVVEPAKAAGMRLEPHLAEMIIRDAGIPDTRSGEERESVTGVLPLLSHALRATWQHRAHGRLTIAGYKATGGIRGAVTQTAERALAELDAPTQAAAMSVLLRLTRLGEDHRQDSRRQQETRALLTETADPEAAQRALEALVRARLVRVEAETTQIIHEALLSAWPRLRSRLDRHRVALLGLQRLEDDARFWADRDRDSSRLYRGDQLDDAQRWAGSGDLGGPGPSALAREFVDAAVATRDLQMAERDRRRARDRLVRRAIAALAVFGLLIAATAAVGWSNAARHEEDANFANLLAQADRLTASDPALAAQLLLVAYRLRPGNPHVQGRVLSTQHVPHAEVRPGPHGAVYFVDHSADGSLLATASETGIVEVRDVADPARVLDQVTAGPSWISTATFDPARPVLATAGSDATVRLWDTSDPSDVVPIAEVPVGHAEISQLAWSPDGRTLVSANGDHTVTVIDVTDPARPTVADPAVQWPGQGIVRAVAFHPRGDLLAAAGDDGRLALFRTGGGRPPTLVDAVPAHPGPIQSLAFSPDGTVLSTGSADKTVRLWAVDAGQPVPLGEPLSGHTATVWSMAWSGPATLITASKDGAARIWNVANRSLPSVVRTMPTATGGVLAIALSPDGRSLVGGGQDGSILRWELPLTVLADNISRVHAIALSPDRQWLATGVGETTVRLWDLGDPGRPVRTGPLDIGATSFTRNVMTFSPDGRTLATHGGGSALRLWDISDTGAVTLLSTVEQRTGYTAAVAVSPDGSLLVTGDSDDTLAFYDIRDRARPVRLPDPPAGHSAYITAALFSRDGDVLVTTSSDGTARLWDVADPRRIAPVGNPHDFGAGQIFAAALSPDDRVLAVAGTDNTVRFWDLTGSVPTPTLTGFDAPPTTLAWSPDGTRLATGGTDRIVRVWHDPLSVEAVADPMTGHAGTVNQVVWRDGRTLVSSGEDQLVLIWDLDVGARVERLCATTRGAFPGARQEATVPELRYGPPCPAP